MFKLVLKHNAKSSLLGDLGALLNSCQQTRSIRQRKPPWIPRSKSKAFRVPPFYEQDQAESEYMKPLLRNYYAEMRSVYQLFKTEAKFTDQLSLKAKEEKKKLMEKQALLLKENDELNKQILAEQMQDEANRLEEMKRKAENEFKEKQRLNQLYFNEAERQVRKLKEKARHFVDPNNLEYEIEKALNERYDYNFSIDSSGRLFKNRVPVTHAQAFDGRFRPLPKSSQVSEEVETPSLPTPDDSSNNSTQNDSKSL